MAEFIPEKKGIAYESTPQVQSRPKFGWNRPELLDSESEYDLNTYRYWSPDVGWLEPFYELDKNGNPVETYPTGDGAPKIRQIKSLFNPVATIGYNTRAQLADNTLLLDTPDSRDAARKAGGGISVRDLVEASERGDLGRAVYSAADFAFCKHLGEMSNNYLVTLRRFPFPAGDHINYSLRGDTDAKNLQAHAPAMGRMVTWMGVSGNDISSILKYTYSMPFKSMTAQMEDVDPSGDSGGLLGTMMNLGGNAAYNKAMLRGQAGTAPMKYTGNLLGSFYGSSVGDGFMAAMDGGQAPYASYNPNNDRTKLWGPIDTVRSIYTRSEEGLQFTNEFDLVFDYELRSFNGINGKTAFLDLLANVLVTTYASGDFWGGGYRSFGSHQNNVFANLPLWKMEPPVSWGKLSTTMTESGSMVQKELSKGYPTGNAAQTALAILKNLGEGLKNMLVGGLLNKLGRPQKQALNSLLSDTPVGVWHITIGNPWHPILSMGNMILKETTIEHYGPLGLDDFPTGLKVTCKFCHGKPRDAMSIERLYTQGENRIYQFPSERIKDTYKNAASVQNKKGEENVKDSDIDVESLKARWESDKVPLKLEDVSVDENSRLGKVLMRHFGTNNIQNIIWTAEEAWKGSQKKGNAKGKDSKKGS